MAAPPREPPTEPRSVLDTLQPRIGRPGAGSAARPTVAIAEPLAARDSACVQAFHEQFDFVYRCVRRYGGRGAELDDLVQEVFIAMWRRWPDFDRTRPLRPWLAGIAFRVARCHVRRRKPEIAQEPVALAERPDDDGQDADDRRQARDLVLEALDRLPERHRVPLVMHELDELTPGEIAGLLSLPLATVYTRVRRARLAFAKVVADLREGVGRRRHSYAFLPAEALLALERTPIAAPPAVRAKASAMVEDVLARRPPPPDPLAEEPAAGGLSPLALGASGAGGLLVLVGAAFLVAGRGPPAAPATAAPTSAAIAPTRAASARTPDRLPRLRTVAPPRAPLASPRALAQGVIGYWRLDEQAGQVARDASGNERHCKVHGLAAPAAWSEGVEGGALALAAQASLECPMPEATGTGPVALSIAAWVKRAGPRAPAALATRQMGRAHENQFFFGFGPSSLRVVSHAWSGWAETEVYPPIGRWFHAAFTHAADGTTRLYVDGLEVSTSGGRPIGKTPTIASTLTIGAGRYSRVPRQLRQRLDGAIDEVLVYDRALAPGEVAALAARVRPLF